MLNARDAFFNAKKNYRPTDYYLNIFLIYIEETINEAVQHGLFETFVLLPPTWQSVKYTNVNDVLTSLGYECKQVNTRGIAVSWKLEDENDFIS